MNSNQNDDALIEFRDAFNQFDNEGTGKIDLKDVAPILRSLGHQVGANFLEEVETNETGKVDLPELLSVFARSMKGADENHHLIAAFKVFDREGSGEITIEDLEKVLANLGDKMSRQEVVEMIREADQDDSGTIDQDEFVRMMMS